MGAGGELLLVLYSVRQALPDGVFSEIHFGHSGTVYLFTLLIPVIFLGW